MSEEELPIHFADTAQAALDANKSAGQLLREAREAQGLHVAALAVSLKVPVKKLEALEADRLEELPDTVFVRALASSVCRALKINAKPVLDKLPQLNTSMRSQEESGVNVAFRTRADGPAPSPLAHLSKPVALGVFALLLAAIVLILLPDFISRSASGAGASSNESVAIANGSSAGVLMGSGVTIVATPDAASATATAAISPSQVANESATVPTLSVTPALSTPSVSSPTLTISTPTPAGASAAPPPADSVVLFTATGQTWIEVKDAGGKVILQRTLQAGEKTGAGPSTGRMPFSVIVGRANLTQVSIRDKEFDLAAVSSKDAVARFQVK